MSININRKVVFSLSLLSSMIIGSVQPAFAATNINVTASGNDGHGPYNTLDGNLAPESRWSQQGDGAWIAYDLLSKKSINELKIAFYNGNIRTYKFDVQTSDDSYNWKTISSGKNQQQTLNLQTIAIPNNVQTRYIRILGHGNTTNDWNAITEFSVDVSSLASSSSSKNSSSSSSSRANSSASSSSYNSVSSSSSSKFSSSTSSRSSSSSSSEPSDVPAGNPGLRNPDGSAHKVHQPNSAPNVIDVVSRADELGYKIDLTDSDASDQNAIIAVLNDSKTTSGSTLYFPNGTYNISAISIKKNGINIEGESKEKTIFKSSLNKTGTAIAISGKNNIVLKNFTVTSTWKGTPPTQTGANNATAGGPDYAITTGSNAYNITIDNVIVEKYRRMGVRLGAGSHDVVVKNSLARKATDIGGGGSGYGFVVQGSGHNNGPTNPYLNDNTKDSYFNLIENNETEGPYIRHAVIVQYWAHNNLIRNNTFDRTQLDAIDLHGEDEYANEVANNTVTNSERAGIALGNSGAGHDKTGVNNWIHDNTLIGCGWGITVQYGTSDSTIENNVVRDNARISASPKCAICLGKSSDSVLRNNTVSNYTVSGYSGVMLINDPKEGDEAAGGPTHWTIEGNRVTNSGTPFKDNSTMDGANVIQSKW